MRYIIPSYGRSHLQKTLQNVPPDFLPHIELFVVPSEYKKYRKEWYGRKLKSIEVWPDHLDMIPKKRKWLAKNVNDNYMMLDDDLSLPVWSKKEQRYISAKDMPKLFMKRMLEVIPSLYDEHAIVSLPMKFMADMYVKKEGLLKKGNIGYVATGFAKGTASKVKFNKLTYMTDALIPLQVMEQHKTSVTYYGVCFSQSQAKDLTTTGIGVYQSNFNKVDSAIKLLQLFPGIVTDFKRKELPDDILQVTLEKRESRYLKGIQQHHIEKSAASLEKWLEFYKLDAAPKIWTYPDDMSRPDIIERMKAEWNKVAQPKGRIK